MRNIKLTIEYNGADFKGWQIQGKGERTVQSEIKKAVKKITGEDTSIIGSGRTDTGVHAKGQTAHFKTSSKLPINRLIDALNGNLPVDISIKDAKEVPLTFHAQYHSKEKTYRYTILNRKTRSAFSKYTALHYPFKLNCAAMKREAKLFIGKKNFRSFQAKDYSRPERSEDTVRTVKNIKVRKNKDIITIDITADGFLYRMCRNIVGMLLEVGSGKLPEGKTKAILKAKDRDAAPAAAPAHGLCLVEVKY